MLILDLWGKSIHAVVVFGLGKNILFKSILGRCGSDYFEMSFWCHGFDQNSNENIVRISALKFLYLTGGFSEIFGLPGDFQSNIIVYKEGYRKPQKVFRKCQGRYKNFKGRNPNNIFVAILVETMTQKRHFEIN